MPTIDTEGKMTEDFEFEQYLHALSASSNRVRHLIFALMLITISLRWFSDKAGPTDGPTAVLDK
jgi:hypothetical protein